MKVFDSGKSSSGIPLNSNTSMFSAITCGPHRATAGLCSARVGKVTHKNVSLCVEKR